MKRSLQCVILCLLALPVTAQTPPQGQLPLMENATPAPTPAPAPAPAVTPLTSGQLPTLPGKPEPALAVPVAAPPASGEQFSYGTSDLSLFFTPAQIQSMKQALSTYESLHGQGADSATPVAEDIPEAPPVVEPSAYPVFFLSSIAFRSPRDWTVWVNGTKITPTKNPTEVKVANVTPQNATFIWTPTYAAALIKRNQTGQFISTDLVKHKLTHPSAYSFDNVTGAVTFTLRPNQSFAAAYLNTFEGYIDSPPVPPLPTATTGANAVPLLGGSGPDVTTGANPAADQGLAQDAIDRMIKQESAARYVDPQQQLRK